jgi:hypothetical protein
MSTLHFAPTHSLTQVVVLMDPVCTFDLNHVAAFGSFRVDRNSAFDRRFVLIFPAPNIVPHMTAWKLDCDLEALFTTRLAGLAAEVLTWMCTTVLHADALNEGQ